MTWTAVGAAKPNVQTANFTLAPAATGNLMIVAAVNNGGATVTCTALTSTNVTWTLIGHQAGSSTAADVALFRGVITSTSSATVTPTWSGTTPSNVCFAGQEYNSTAGSWSVDTFTGLNSAGTNTWPSLTPAGSGELYYGYAVDLGSASSGSTSGYTYFPAAAGNGQAYRLSCPAGVATAPVWGDSGHSCGFMALLAESGGAAVTRGELAGPAVQAVRRASYW